MQSLVYEEVNKEGKKNIYKYPIAITFCSYGIFVLKQKLTFKKWNVRNVMSLKCHYKVSPKWS